MAQRASLGVRRLPGHGLVAAKALPAHLSTDIRWRQRFCELIGNTDMHGGKLQPTFGIGCNSTIGCQKRFRQSRARICHCG